MARYKHPRMTTDEFMDLHNLGDDEFKEKHGATKAYAATMELPPRNYGKLIEDMGKVDEFGIKDMAWSHALSRRGY